MLCNTCNWYQKSSTMLQEEMYRKRWEMAIDDAFLHVVAENTDGLTYVTTSWGLGLNVKQSTMEHLTCFLPGNIALGVLEKGISPAKAEKYLELAEKLTYTCWQMYERTISGLALLDYIFHMTG